MSDDLSALYRLTPSDSLPAAGVLARAFHEDAAWMTLFPDAGRRRRVAHALYLMEVRDAIRFGEVYAPSSGLEGVAAWLPDHHASLTWWRMLRAGGLGVLRAVGWRQMLQFWPLVGVMDSARARFVDPPYLYLTVIGVDPPHQAQGCGGALIRPVLARCDQERLPCYLETQSDHAASIYAHYGFAVCDVITVPGTTITFRAMRRTPQS